ncbi:MAG: hypothetical protein GPI96_20590 [Microcystis aeruginosa BS13-02]|nr:hypothetical protein [Microcystis aeruginosa BS13-02]
MNYEGVGKWGSGEVGEWGSGGMGKWGSGGMGKLSHHPNTLTPPQRARSDHSNSHFKVL